MWFAGGGRETIWKEKMRSSRVCGWTLAASLIACGIGLTVLPAASADPGDTGDTDQSVSPDVAAPMTQWSLSAAKLLLVMGVQGGGDTLNSTANDLNTEAHEAQLA